MYDANAKRLMEMAAERRMLRPPPNGLKPYPVGCLQCGDVSYTKHTDMASGDVSFWCTDCWDFWWIMVTVPKLHRSGLIQHIADAIVPANSPQSSPDDWYTPEASFWRN